jgi:hypothetical protein
MLWQIVNNVDTQKARDVPLFVRAPFIEMEGRFHDRLVEELAKDDAKNGTEKTHALMESLLNSFKFTDNLPSPRVIKTHLPFEMLPPKLLDTCKVVFVARNPKDCCVSFYHHHNTLDYYYKGDFEQFEKLFMDGTVEFGNYWTLLKVLYIF